MTAAEVFESVTCGGASDFNALAQILSVNKPWCLIGGLAVNCYVEPVYTVDADMVAVTDRLPRISEQLEQVGFQIQRFEHSICAKGRTSQLRIRFTTDARYQESLADKEVRNVLGQRVPVAALENVILGKIWAWKDQTRRASKRKKDELDLLRIAELIQNYMRKFRPKLSNS